MSDWRPPAPPPERGRRSSTPSPGQAPWSQPQPPSDHDPAGMQSILTRARDQSRFVAPEIAPHREKAPFPWRAVALVFASVLVLAVGVGAFYALVLRTPATDPDTIVQVSEGGTQVQLRTPQEAVGDYLEALAAGDITTALSLGELGGIGSEILLDPEVHARTRELAPITDIRILTEDPQATDVEVSYLLAGQPVETSIPVVRNDSGSYELARTTVTFIIELGSAEALPLIINGVDVPKFVPVEVVPGFYEVSTGLPFIEYPADNSFQVGSLDYASENRRPATPQLTPAGEEALRTSVRSSLDRCFRAQVLAPEGCPQSIVAPMAVDRSTIRWQLVGNPLANSEPSLSAEDLTIGTMTLNLRYTVTFRYADGSDSGINEGSMNPRATANMLGRDASTLAVIWRQ